MKKRGVGQNIYWDKLPKRLHREGSFYVIFLLLRRVSLPIHAWYMNEPPSNEAYLVETSTSSQLNTRVFVKAWFLI